MENNYVNFVVFKEDEPDMGISKGVIYPCIKPYVPKDSDFAVTKAIVGDNTITLYLDDVGVEFYINVSVETLKRVYEVE